jgi:Transglycosylase SLT domain
MTTVRKRIVARNVNHFGVRLLASLALLCAVSACGTLRNRAPATSTAAEAALGQAMARENVPMSWYEYLRFIMEKESGGRVGVQNTGQSSARGLFQLIAANYYLNPRGADSFGNGVEEAQGGIRYIKQRYGTADNAVVHWQQFNWY